MDGESYENPALAEFLNEHFVCIKVDRDERPDVDARYQRAVQALTRQGGWPLTAFLTPAGEVFFGGTYFPPDGKYGRPGFRTVLGERARRLPRAARTRSMAQAAGDPPGARRAPRRGRAGRAVARHARRRRRPDGPGVRSGERRIRQPAQVSPSGRASRCCCTAGTTSRRTQIRTIIDRTLQGMARGGVYDQLGGGFHRYSVDAEWIVPHFEKMSYDNSELLKAYLDAYALLRHRGVRRRGARASCAGCARSRPIRRAATPPARTPTWGSTTTATTSPGPATRRPRCSTPEELEVAAAYYDIGTAGEMHHNPGKNVLFVAATVAALASRTGRSRRGRRRRCSRSARDKLLAAARPRGPRRSSTAPATPTGTP